MMHISVCSFEDYDKVLVFLLKHDAPITHSDKEGMIIIAKMSEKLANQMYADAGFKNDISVWETMPD
ncbi:MAG: hypothetical protein Q8L11_00650 [Candidatus Moranbacteria bacterium]|nr:hypothetical protein [Candidatus Moranbacteria bacterium]